MINRNKVKSRKVLPENPLLRLLMINCIAGVGVAALVFAGILWSNIGNLRVLVQTAENPILPLFMLGFALVITLGSVVMGSAIMLLGEKDRDRGGPGKGRRNFADEDLAPVPVTVRAHHRRQGRY